MQSGIAQAVGDLIKSGNAETGRTGYTIPGFQLDDVYPIFRKYLNAQAQQALDTKTYSLVHQYNREVAPSGLCKLLNKLKLKSCSNFDDGIYVRHADLVYYCASRSNKGTLPKATEKVIAAINDLASHGYITAALLPMSVMALNNHDCCFEPEYVVLSYFALTQDGHDYVEKCMPKMFIEEGSFPERFENQ